VAAARALLLLLRPLLLVVLRWRYDAYD